MRILLVDDDRELIDLLAFALKRAGLEPIAAHDARAAVRIFEERQPDLVVLDINLGASSGLDVLKELRRRSQLPVIMLTALDSEEDKVRGLEAGADDYLTKPFSHRELVARIRAQLRRSAQEWSPRRAPETRLQVGTVTLNLAEHSVTKSGQQVSLTVTEFGTPPKPIAGVASIRALYPWCDFPRLGTGPMPGSLRADSLVVVGGGSVPCIYQVGGQVLNLTTAVRVQLAGVR